MKILSPNKQYTGNSAGVEFVQGIGHCTNPHLIPWFVEKGYTVVEEDKDEDLDFKKMTVKKLKEYAEANGIDLGEATKKADILEKIVTWQKEGD
jgi:hypothetical protein